MPTYSLLQTSLDQTIGREAMEEASLAVPSVARADCAGMARDLFGIVVSSLPREDAEKFQAALRTRGFSTDIIADAEIPHLHEAFTIQRITLDPEALVFTDTMGREKSRPREELVFVAGGFLTRSRGKSVTVQERSTQARPSLTITHEVREYRQEQEPEFRMDFFFHTAPHRLRATLSADSTVFFRGRPLRLRDTTLLLGAMMDLRELLPPARVSNGLRRDDTRTYYPSLHAYEEEIRWHFHQLKSQG